MASVSALWVYPVKSVTGTALEHAVLTPRGIELDRWLALVGEDGEVVTAREHPKLLRLDCTRHQGGLAIRDRGREVITVALEDVRDAVVELTVHEAPARGAGLDPAVDGWFSEFLGQPVRLVYAAATGGREVLADCGGLPGDVVAFADECPILLAGEASLTDLNRRLAEPASMRQFRPNIVVEGLEPFAEDGWSRVRIGGLELAVAQRCQRCVFTTIDPESQRRHPRQEPLRTLASYRPHPDGGAAFGVHLIPRSSGELAVGDEVVVLA